MRSLSVHLFELSQMLVYFDNSSKYTKGNNVIIIQTKNIAQWLELASYLKKVEIDTFKFSGMEAMMCRPHADYLTSTSKHFSTYSTVLTKFNYISYALDEMYKFVAYKYDYWVNENSIPRKDRVNSASIKASVLLNNTDDVIFPKNFEHLSLNYLEAFKKYTNIFNLNIERATLEYNSTPSFSLDLLRNLRNHIAHGKFPIIEDPQNDYEKSQFLSELLFLSCRISALYIQIFMRNYNTGIKNKDSEVFIFLDIYLEEDNINLDEFLLRYIKDLHLQNNFAFNPADYDNFIADIEY